MERLHSWLVLQTYYTVILYTMSLFIIQSVSHIAVHKVPSGQKNTLLTCPPVGKSIGFVLIIMQELYSELHSYIYVEGIVQDWHKYGAHSTVVICSIESLHITFRHVMMCM